MSLQLRKLDLHVHTPASHDFADKAVTADAIVRHAQDVGLDAIAITDHNTVDHVDRMKEAAAKRGFTVFPGFEVSCGGSVSGSIHVIGIFDPSKGKDDLQKVLGKLDVHGMDESALTSKSPSDVVDIIKGAGGLTVLAHANSTHGALNDIKGSPRTSLVKNPNLSAVEATSGDFARPVGKRLIDYLDGSDPTYKRKVAVYKSSDNPVVGAHGHCIEAIGSHFTYFRMGALTLESLRECFEDRDSRVVQHDELEKLEIGHPRIEWIEVDGGFLDKQNVPFHHGMNSIIGGTGTGKSLLIELLRFAFDRAPSETLLSDHKQKLQKQLRPNGVVKVAVRDNSGDQYLLSRKFDGGRDPYTTPSICVNVATGKKFSGDLKALFPLLIYSQNEILEITRDSKAQLHLLDNFRDFEGHQNRVAALDADLAKNDRKLTQAIQDAATCAQLKKQLAGCENGLAKVEKEIEGVGKAKTAEPFLALSAERDELTAKIEGFDSLFALIDEAIETFESDTPARASGATAGGRIESGLRTAYRDVVSGLRSSRKDAEVARKKASGELAKWEKEVKFAEAQSTYAARIKLRKKAEETELRRKALSEEKADLTKRIGDAEKAAKAYVRLRAERNDLLSKLATARTTYFDERASQAQMISQKSAGKLRIDVQAGEDRSTYVTLLQGLKVGSYAEKREIESVANALTPVELVNRILDGEYPGIAKAAKIAADKAAKIGEELLNPANLLKTLALQYHGYPRDSISISYRKKDGSYHPLSELSMGQKADALVMIALGDGRMPVVIDQPEDALDIPSIWADICSRLRISKHARQFIFTTHNSSISVSSDSDQFVVFEADGTRGWMARCGSIDEQAIKDDVVDHLEGGYESYGLKRKKYGL